MHLTEEELSRIFVGLPYREGWSAFVEEGIFSGQYAEVVAELTDNPHFQTAEGLGGNYLVYYCYPKAKLPYVGNAIDISISLNAPIASYGELYFNIDSHGMEMGSYELDSIGNIADPELKKIEKEIRKILTNHRFEFIETEFAIQRLPQEISERMKGKNLHGHQVYYHGIFQFYEDE